MNRFLKKGKLDTIEAGGDVLTVYKKDGVLKNGGIVEAEISNKSYSLKIAGVLSDSPFSSEGGVETVICSETTFEKLTGKTRYTIIDIQTNGDISENEVSAIREMAGSNITFSDKRMGNREVKGAYYSFALFVYGFLVIIALIAIINIINSIAMSVSARMHQYGAMRAIGMGEQQLLHMVAAEAMTYTVIGIIVGSILGLLLNRLLYINLVTNIWGTPSYFPTTSIVIILLTIVVATCVAIHGPAKRIKHMSIVETISAE